MSIGLVRKIRARKGCASGIHIKFHKPASDDDVSEYLTALSKRGEAKASQEKLNLSYAVRQLWTGWMPWAGTYVETREQGLLAWWKELKHDRSKISKKNPKRTRATATNKRGGKGNSSIKQRTKKVVGKSKRSDKRAKTRTV